MSCSCIIAIVSYSISATQLALLWHHCVRCEEPEYEQEMGEASAIRSIDADAGTQGLASNHHRLQST